MGKAVSINKSSSLQSQLSMTPGVEGLAKALASLQGANFHSLEQAGIVDEQSNINTKSWTTRAGSGLSPANCILNCWRIVKTSSARQVCEMYETTAESYAIMMDTEIKLPVYAETLGRLHERIAKMPGVLTDTACGSGHMLSMFHQQFDRNRPLLGVDLSPKMVAIAAEKIGSAGRVVVGNMCDLPAIESEAAVAVINFFAIHHLGPEQVQQAAREWHRILKIGGQLVLAAWEGVGVIDYGDQADIVALRYTSEELRSWFEKAGFAVSRCAVEDVEDFPMDAVYLEGTKQ
jgi:SAM-dependent methyltransferase